MPPIKLYIFEHLTIKGTIITIQAYNFMAAMETLVQITKSPVDYKLISN